MKETINYLEHYERIENEEDSMKKKEKKK